MIHLYYYKEKRDNRPYGRNLMLYLNILQNLNGLSD